jgi:ubiquinone/menaquinone biosynthesis C-methylase UbiE
VSSTVFTPRQVSVAEIEAMNFSRLVGFVDEPNMCSGGAATLRTVLRESPVLSAGRRALEVGSNTGFSVLELASMSDADIYGIDIEQRSVDLARGKAAALGLGNAHFQVGDGTRIGFPDDHFAMVFASNVTSFIPDRVKAVDEYYRVLAPFGVLAAAPIFYAQEPPERLRDEVEAAIGAPLPRWSRADWEALFERPGAKLFFAEEYSYTDLSADQIDGYVAAVLDQPVNADLDGDLRAAAAERLRYFYTLFNENLRYAHYAVLLYRNGQPTSFPVLHTSAPVTGRTWRG